jgi:hypothetical protein
MKISRRGALKGAAAAALAGGASRFVVGCGSDESASMPGPPEVRTLQVELPPAFVGVRTDDVKLHVGGLSYDLVPHTDETRAAARADNPFLRSLPDSELTDYVPGVAFSSDGPQLYTVTYAREGGDPADNRRGLLITGISIPRAAIREAQAIKGNHFNLNPQRVRAAAVHVLAGETVAEETADFVSWDDSARSFIAHHPELMSLDSVTMALVMSLIAELPETKILANVMASLGALERPDSQYVGWADAVFSLDYAGEKMPRHDKNGVPIRDAAGNLEYEFDYIPAPEVLLASKAAIQTALRMVRNDPDLENRKYFIKPGFHAVVNDEGPPGDGDPGDGGGALVNGMPRGRRRMTAPSEYTVAFDREGEWRYGQRVSRTTVNARTIGLRVDNSYYRYLGVFTCFKDVDGNPMKLTDLGLTATEAFDTEYCQYQTMIDPPARLMGFPYFGTEEYKTFEITLPEKASKVALISGGLAFSQGDQRPEYDGVATPGIAMTVVFSYALPVIFLALGGSTTTSKNKIVKVAAALGPFIIKYALKVGLTSTFKQGPSDPVYSGFLQFSNVALKQLAVRDAVWLAEMYAEAAAEGAVKAAAPLVGWVLFAVDAAVTAAEIITTTVQLALSRQYVDTTAGFTHALEVTIEPDPEHPGAFPQVATRVLVVAMCSEAQTFNDDQPFSPTSDPVPLVRNFAAIPSGGVVTVTVFFLSASGWIAGVGSVEVPNVLTGDTRTLAVTVKIKEQLVPLSSSTKYTHAKKLTSTGAAHAWLATTIAPEATQDAVDCRPSSSGLCKPTSITYSTKAGQLGYSYEAAAPTISACGTGQQPGLQVYHLQNINDSKLVGDGTPDAALSVTACGYRQPVLLCYEPRGAVDGNHFAIVPLPSGGYVARKIRIGEKTTFPYLESAPIVGRFNASELTMVRYHPAGFLVALNPSFNKIEVLRTGKTFGNVAYARVATIVAGAGTTRGLIDGPVAIAPTSTGLSFLVLESRNQRIQAMGIDDASPVNYFASSVASIAPLRPEANVTYLDICVEGTGYIYVLSYANAGMVTGDYRIDIYSPNGSWLARTEGVAAARMVVDVWRNLYTLNFERIIVAGRTEPSVSQWLPSTP